MRNMRDVVICRTRNRSYYAINREKKKVFLIAPKFASRFGSNEEEKKNGPKNSYYDRKYEYWRKYGVTEGLKHSYDGTLSEEWIQMSLSDLRQIVFEVTDDCNLSCKYCAYREFYQDFDNRKKQSSILNRPRRY